MSSRRLDLRAQARELADEIQIPVTELASRPVAPEPDPTIAAEAELGTTTEEQGREALTPLTPLAPKTSARPKLVKQQSASAHDRSVEDLISDDRELAPLSVRVPRRVRAELDRQVYTLKAKGKKIKMEDVVTAALVLFLRIDDGG